MTYRLEVLPFAEEDIQEAFTYHEDISETLAEDLLSNIQLAFDEIVSQPLLPAILFKGVRKVNTRRFLYGIYYYMDKKVIKVFAVMHLKRDPKLWRKRWKKK